MKGECTSKKVFLNRSFLIGFALYTSGLVLALAIASSAMAGENAAAGLTKLLPADAPGEWRATGDLVTARAYQTATLLPNGQVLVAGGVSFTQGGDLASAELYDPATGMWTETGSMVTAHRQHTATLLLDGQVLVTGGNFEAKGGVEQYDPATGSWMHTDNLRPSRFFETATLLRSGIVIVAGGNSIANLRTLSGAELYKSPR